MNNLAYNSQKVEEVAPRVEEKIREEIGAGVPLSYEVQNGNAGQTSVGTILGDTAKAFLGGGVTTLYHLDFSLPQPRPAQLLVTVDRQGRGSCVGLLTYSTALSKPVGGEVELEDPKMFGKSKFKGDPTASARLNNHGDLIKRVNNLARTESQIGGFTLKIKRFCKIVPHGSGSQLVINTLPRSTKMGLSATVDAKEFFDIAAMVEAAL